MKEDLTAGAEQALGTSRQVGRSVTGIIPRGCQGRSAHVIVAFVRPGAAVLASEVVMTTVIRNEVCNGHSGQDWRVCRKKTTNMAFKLSVQSVARKPVIFCDCPKEAFMLYSRKSDANENQI